MTALSSSAIQARLAEGDLVISPLLDKREQAKVGQASIDVRLGFNFCFVTASSFGALGEFSSDGIQQEPYQELYRQEYVPFGGSIVIHPHQFILAQTLEYLSLPPDLMSYVVGRSTWGRLGLIVATAVGIQPSFAGSLTLELRNLGETPLHLYPGQSIAQLFFHTVVDEDGQPSTAVPEITQYTGAVDMVPKQTSSESARVKLAKLTKEYKEQLKS